MGCCAFQGSEINIVNDVRTGYYDNSRFCLTQTSLFFLIGCMHQPVYWVGDAIPRLDPLSPADVHNLVTVEAIMSLT